MSNSELKTDVEAFVEDLGKRALSSAWQAGLSTFGILESAGGLDLHSFLSLSGIERVWTVVGVAVSAAVFSAGKTAVLAYLKSTQGRAQEKAIAQQAFLSADGGKDLTAVMDAVKEDVVAGKEPALVVTAPVVDAPVAPTTAPPTATSGA